MGVDKHYANPSLDRIKSGTVIIAESTCEVGGTTSRIYTLSQVTHIKDGFAYTTRAYMSTDMETWADALTMYPKYKGESLTSTNKTYTVKPINGDLFDIAHSLGII